MYKLKFEDVELYGNLQSLYYVWRGMVAGYHEYQLFIQVGAQYEEIAEDFEDYYSAEIHK